jgi:Predicted oxidoreductases (related to aryl-alcohol dehydrogenases)
LQGTALSGSASPEGTAKYAARIVSRSRHDGHMEHGYGQFGNSGWTTSRLGFGTYRVDTRDIEHRDALKKALREGVNLIDTSTNYMDGDSERLVGSVLGELIKNGELIREEVIIVSKIGYVQGDNLKQAEARERTGRPYPDMVKYGEGIWHCIHPEYLADQLTLSLDRLDWPCSMSVCCTIQNTFFPKPRIMKAEISRSRDTFYRRIEQAFTYFESQVAGTNSVLRRIIEYSHGRSIECRGHVALSHVRCSASCRCGTRHRSSPLHGAAMSYESLRGRRVGDAQYWGGSARNNVGSCTTRRDRGARQSSAQCHADEKQAE